MNKIKKLTLTSALLLGLNLSPPKVPTAIANETLPMFYQRMQEIGQVLATYEVARLMCETIDTYPDMKYEDKIRLVVSRLDNEMAQIFMETDSNFIQTLLDEYISEHCAEAYRNNLNK